MKDRRNWLIDESENVTVISLPNLILLPGLMDSHVHIVGNDSKGEESIADSSHMGTVWGVVNAKKL